METAVELPLPRTEAWAHAVAAHAQYVEKDPNGHEFTDFLSESRESSGVVQTHGVETGAAALPT
jgi:hypothetical protein